MAESLTSSPNPFPLDLDASGERLRLVSLTEGDFRAASFLDERILAEGVAERWIATAQAQAAAADLTGESDFIFHIGHVGSTLLSRLLGVGERVFSVREPAILRTLSRLRRPEVDGASARSPALDSHLEMALKLLARVWRPAQRSLVKATSFVSEMAPDMLAASPGSRALLMFVSPQTHIATRLGGPASRAELPTVAGEWLQRLHRRVGGGVWRLESMSEGERAALGWVCEICALARVARRFPSRVRWVDFQGFLLDPAAGLRDAIIFLRGAPLAGEIAGMLASGDLGRYAKAPQFTFDARTRAELIAQSAREHGGEIARGIAWINAAANAFPIIAQSATAPAEGVAGRGDATSS